MRTRTGMRAGRLLVAMMLMTAGGRAAAGTAQATLTVTATVVRSIAVTSVAVSSNGDAGVVGARAPGIETSVRGGDRDVRWDESREERVGSDGRREMLVTVFADGKPPAFEIRAGR
jgi:hypothetical protein